MYIYIYIQADMSVLCVGIHGGPQKLKDVLLVDSPNPVAGSTSGLGINRLAPILPRIHKAACEGRSIVPRLTTPQAVSRASRSSQGTPSPSALSSFRSPGRHQSPEGHRIMVASGLGQEIKDTPVFADGKGHLYAAYKSSSGS